MILFLTISPKCGQGTVLGDVLFTVGGLWPLPALLFCLLFLLASFNLTKETFLKFSERQFVESRCESRLVNLSLRPFNIRLLSYGDEYL
jgi:hypothetical protein